MLVVKSQEVRDVLDIDVRAGKFVHASESWSKATIVLREGAFWLQPDPVLGEIEGGQRMSTFPPLVGLLFVIIHAILRDAFSKQPC